MDRPTIDSINTIAEWFFAGFTRVTGTDTNERERSEVYDVSHFTESEHGKSDNSSGYAKSSLSRA
jgi:hypothetical protein